MKKCSSRNTVQFLNEIDRNHESQPRKSLKKILLINTRPIINSTEKIHVILYMQHIYIIFSLLCGDCLNFLLWMVILRGITYNVYKRIFINFLYQRPKIQRFFRFFGNFLYWYGNFCHFTAPSGDFPNYLGISCRIQ